MSIIEARVQWRKSGLSKLFFALFLFLALARELLVFLHARPQSPALLPFRTGQCESVFGKAYWAIQE